MGKEKMLRFKAERKIMSQNAHIISIINIIED
jgi:hypothetical protein